MIVSAPVVEAHVDAILARIRARPALAHLVFEGDVTGDPEVYVNVYHDTGFFTGHDLNEHQTDVEITLTIHGIGTTREQAVWASSAVTAQLLGFVPIVHGRRCWRLRQAGSQPVTKDMDATPPKFFTADRWVLRSTPARQES